MMSENDIEIGMNIIPNIYLHLENEELATPFDVRKIFGVYPLPNSGTIITYAEINPQDEKGFTELHYYVREKSDYINDAIHKAKEYREFCINSLSEYIDKKNAPE